MMYDNTIPKYHKNPNCRNFYSRLKPQSDDSGTVQTQSKRTWSFFYRAPPPPTAEAAVDFPLVMDVPIETTNVVLKPTTGGTTVV